MGKCGLSECSVVLWSNCIWWLSESLLVVGEPLGGCGQCFVGYGVTKLITE